MVVSHSPSSLSSRLSVGLRCLRNGDVSKPGILKPEQPQGSRPLSSPARPPDKGTATASDEDPAWHPLPQRRSPQSKWHSRSFLPVTCSLSPLPVLFGFFFLVVFLGGRGYVFLETSRVRNTFMRIWILDLYFPPSTFV